MSSSSQTQPTVGRMLVRWLVPAVYLLSVLGASAHVALHHGAAHGAVADSGQPALSAPDCGGHHHTEGNSACSVCATLLRTLAVPVITVPDGPPAFSAHIPALSFEVPPSITRALPGQRGPPRQV